MFIDTHAHIYQEYYDNILDVIDRAKKNEVSYIINNGCDDKSNKEVLSCLDKEAFYGALGIHPEAVDNYTLEDIRFIEKNIKHQKVVAIGEIGLDYYYTKENKEKQKELFEMQLALAQKYDMPVIIHSREATKDTIDILKKYKVNGVIHSFSGSIETANIYIKMGFKLGINGVITFKNANLKDVIKELDLKNIVLETDSPYLTPHPYRGKKNEPMYIKDIAKYICELKNISIDELSKIININVCEIYKKINF